MVYWCLNLRFAAFLALFFTLIVFSEALLSPHQSRRNYFPTPKKCATTSVIVSNSCRKIGQVSNYYPLVSYAKRLTPAASDKDHFGSTRREKRIKKKSSTSLFYSQAISPKILRPSKLCYERYIRYPSQNRKKLSAVVLMSIMTLLFLTTHASPANAFLGTIPMNGNKLNLAAVAGFYKSMPYTSAFVTCGIKSAIADYIAQLRARTSEINFKRNNAFFLYGGLYLGIAQYFIYNKVFPVLFGAGNSTTAVISKVMADMLIVAPFLCMPLAYLTKAIVFRQSLASGIAKYWKEVKNGLLLKCWSLWIPVQLLTFSVVPEHLRIVFVASVSFFWTIILSSLASGSTKNEISHRYDINDDKI